MKKKNDLYEAILILESAMETLKKAIANLEDTMLLGMVKKAKKKRKTKK